MEYGIMVRLIRHPDFREGVRALLIDKDNEPQLAARRPEVIGDRDVDAFFEPLPAEEQWRPLRFLEELKHERYETILVEQRGAVTLVTLNRPQALNALNSQVLAELIAAFAAYDADDSQRCLVLTGIGKGLRRRRRHQGDAEPGLRRHVFGQFLRRLGAGHRDPQAVDRRGRGLSRSAAAAKWR